MQPWEIMVISLVAAMVFGYVGLTVYERKKRHHLQEHFGDEYNQTIAELGGQRRAESELSRREERIRKLQIRPLGVMDREKFSEHWKLCQARFVDDPVGALRHADNLVIDIMRFRGYAVDTPDNRTADISAAFPSHAMDYRFATGILSRAEEVPTADLRKAFLGYRALFDEMLGDQHEELKRAA